MARNRDFGRRVKKEREKLGAKRDRLAQLSRIAANRLEMIEFGQADAQLKSACVIARRLKC